MQTTSNTLDAEAVLAAPKTRKAGAALSGPQALNQAVWAICDVLRRAGGEDAAAVLGRPFAIEGVVRRGRQLGRQLGFPTANVELDDYVAPRLGIYATRTRMRDGRVIPGVANIGTNPTVGEVQARLEVHLFDFDRELYDAHLRVNFLHKLRDEVKYDSLDALTAQIARDCQDARDHLNRMS